MTYAPQALLDLRAFMRPLTSLPDNELGITPDASHNGGYHCGWDLRRIVNGSLNDYSWQESSRDWNHKTNAARAFDVGMFPLLRELSVWMVAECENNAPDTQDIREIIYSPDGLVVKRWDRLKRRSSGDSSHLKHTHFGFFADAENRDKIGPFKRFFEGVNMGALDWIDPRVEALAHAEDTIRFGPGAGAPVETVLLLKRLETKLDQLLATPPGSVNPDVIRALVREELDATGVTGKLGRAA